MRKREALRIDPNTALVCWCYSLSMDPCQITSDLPEELQQVGREHFARSPDSDVWVSFWDLPEKVRDALGERHAGKLMFPAGLAEARAALDE